MSQSSRFTEEELDEDSSHTLDLEIDKQQREDKSERGLRIGLYVTSAFDAIAMVVIIVAILVQMGNRDNYIFLLNVQHVLWWFVTCMIAGVAANKVWWSVYIGLSALWLVMDAVSLIWRAVLLHNCYNSSSSAGCRDFEIQAWFIIISNGVFIITDIVFIVLGVLLRRKVIKDRARVKAFEEDCKKRLLPTSCPPTAASCPQKPHLEEIRSVFGQPTPTSTSTSTSVTESEFRPSFTFA